MGNNRPHIHCSLFYWIGVSQAKIMIKFTPEDLKKYWKGKYDKLKCSLNGKGEWICGNGKTIGRIVVKTNDQKIEYPDLEIREPVSTGGYGLNIWKTALKSTFKVNGSTSTEIKVCSNCKRQFSSLKSTCPYCKIGLIVKQD